MDGVVLLRTGDIWYSASIYLSSRVEVTRRAYQRCVFTCQWLRLQNCVSAFMPPSGPSRVHFRTSDTVQYSISLPKALAVNAPESFRTPIDHAWKGNITCAWLPSFLGAWSSILSLDRQPLEATCHVQLQGAEGVMGRHRGGVGWTSTAGKFRACRSRHGVHRYHRSGRHRYAYWSVDPRRSSLVVPAVTPLRPEFQPWREWKK